MDQKMPMNRPFWFSVGYANISEPWAVQSNPAQTPRMAPATITKALACGWMLMALDDNERRWI